MRRPVCTLRLRPFAALLALGALVGCYETQPPPTPPVEGCPTIDAPVCGDDGMTYANECSADAAGVTVARTGPCEPTGPCTGDDDCDVGFVCNVPPDCRDSTCAPGAPCLPPLPCEERKVCETCVCPDVYDPVCGVDGVTYGNGCEARCAHVGILPRPGACGAPTCPSPVPPDVCNAMCGAGGGTYTTGEDGCLYCTCNPVPPLECGAVACTLACEFGFVLGPDGCPLCECAPEPPAQRLCLSNENCDTATEYCDTSTCFSAPCPPGMACPDVCYGVCTPGRAVPPPGPVPGEDCRTTGCDRGLTCVGCPRGTEREYMCIPPGATC
jgi:hypothetical protein